MVWKLSGPVLAAVLAATLVTAGVAISQLAPESADPSLYRLPWAAGEANRHSVIQGNYTSGTFGDCTSGCVTHGDPDQHFAWDFDLPEGTEVLASRSGTVAIAIGSWGSDHCGGLSATDAGDGIAGQFIGNETNLVEIAHGDGSSALYLHLSHVSPSVERKAKTGEPVQQGEVLGTSGKTGFTRCVPHLHFQVEPSVRGDWFTTSIPVSFGDQDVITRATGGAPVEGQSYISDNVPVGGAP